MISSALNTRLTSLMRRAQNAVPLVQARDIGITDHNGGHQRDGHEGDEDIRDGIDHRGDGGHEQSHKVGVFIWSSRDAGVVFRVISAMTSSCRQRWRRIC